MPSLYITREDGTLGLKGEALYWHPGRGEKSTVVPSAQITDVIVLGNGNITTPALHKLMQTETPVHYLTASGQYLGSLTSGRGHSYMIKKLQYDAVRDPARAIQLSRAFMTGKLLNQRSTLLRYYYRGEQNNSRLAEACAEMKKLIGQLNNAAQIEELRGIEGAAAQAYFSALALIIPRHWHFYGRNRRPPRDPVNAMLSLGYTLLLNSIVSAALIAGLDPCVGFLHPQYRGRPSLALDLIEEFRSPLVDRLVLSLCRTDTVTPADFSNDQHSGVTMTKETQTKFIRKFSEGLRTSLINRSTGRQSTAERHIRMQSAVFVQALRSGEDYIPFLRSI